MEPREYGSDLKTPPIARQITRLAKALAAEKPFVLDALEGGRWLSPKDAWWESLTTDPKTLTEAWARKR